MNTRLLTLTLIVLLGLVGPLEASHLQQQSLALQQQGLTLAQTYRHLTDQQRALLDQLTLLNPTAKPKDWNDLSKRYHKVTLDNATVQQDLAAYNLSGSKTDWNTYKNDLKQLTSDQNDYKNQLNGLTPTQSDAQAFQNQVTALLTALEAVQQQLDANAQAWAAYKDQDDQLNADKKEHNVKHGKN